MAGYDMAQRDRQLHDLPQLLVPLGYGTFKCFIAIDYFGLIPFERSSRRNSGLFDPRQRERLQSIQK